jgi:hypothetical protein
MILGLQQPCRAGSAVQKLESLADLVSAAQTKEKSDRIQLVEIPENLDFRGTSAYDRLVDELFERFKK